MSTPIDGTRYTVTASPVFASDRWRWTLTAPGPNGPVVVTGSVATYATEALAIQNGADYARRLAKALRKLR